MAQSVRPKVKTNPNSLTKSELSKEINKSKTTNIKLKNKPKETASKNVTVTKMHPTNSNVNEENQKSKVNSSKRNEKILIKETSKSNPGKHAFVASNQNSLSKVKSNNKNIKINRNQPAGKDNRNKIITSKELNDQRLDEVNSILTSEPKILKEDKIETQDNLISDYEDDFEDYDSDFEDDESKLDQTENEENNDISDKNSGDLNYENHLSEAFEKNEKVNEKEIEEKHLSSKIENKFCVGEQNFLQVITTNNWDKNLKRGTELLEIIKLNGVRINIYTSPPIDYEVFIKTFGSKNTKQMASQVIKRRDKETQTIEIPRNQASIQHPYLRKSNDSNQNSTLTLPFSPSDPFKLIEFLTRAEIIISCLFNVEFQTDKTRPLTGDLKKLASKRFTFKCPSLAKDCPITQLFTNNFYIFAVQNISKKLGSTEKSVISVWSLLQKSRPVKTLIARSHIKSAAANEGSLVVAGLVDGSVLLWDISEESHWHKELLADNIKWTLRLPSYSTAGTGIGHKNRIVALTKNDQQNSNHLSLHFATLDEFGIVFIWFAVETTGEITSDPGISPGSRVKLAKSVEIDTRKQHPQCDFFAKTIQFDLNDDTLFYVGTDVGNVLRCSIRQEDLSNLAVYSVEEFNLIPSKTRTVKFNKHNTSNFLVGYSDGTICLFYCDNPNPSQIWTVNESVSEINWLTYNLFMVLENYKLVQFISTDEEVRSSPVIFDCSNYKVNCFSTSNGGELQLLLLGSSEGNIEIFILNMNNFK